MNSNGGVKSLKHVFALISKANSAFRPSSELEREARGTIWKLKLDIHDGVRPDRITDPLWGAFSPNVLRALPQP